MPDGEAFRELGHVEVDDAPAMVNEHDENEEDAQTRGGNREDVEGGEISDMVVEEGPPGLGRRCAPLRHQPGNGSLGHVDAELEELGMDAWRTQSAAAGEIRLTRAVISALTGGRPGNLRSGGRRASSRAHGSDDAATAGQCRATR
jgi:hypothetical protein